MQKVSSPWFEARKKNKKKILILRTKLSFHTLILLTFVVHVTRRWMKITHIVLLHKKKIFYSRSPQSSLGALCQINVSIIHYSIYIFFLSLFALTSSVQHLLTENVCALALLDTFRWNILFFIDHSNHDEGFGLFFPERKCITCFDTWKVFIAINDSKCYIFINTTSNDLLL